MMRYATLLLTFVLAGCGELDEPRKSTLANTPSQKVQSADSDSAPAEAAARPATVQVGAGRVYAGVARVDVTNRNVVPVNDPLYVKALVLKQDTRLAVIVTVDAVSIGEIGYIGNDYLPKVRSRLQKELSLAPESFMVNASHCHGIVASDVADKTVQAVKEAMQNLVPVRIGTGVGHENRIMENRRLKLKSGKEVDVRHAYSMPPDEDVAEVGPIDPQIGLLRLDKLDGRTLAVVYNFACHPIMGLPNGENTADIVGFASKVIEGNLSDGAMAFFVQGCAGDINPIGYKDVHQPRNAEPLGNMLGLSVLAGVRKIKCVDDVRFKMIRETIKLPRADLRERIEALVAEQARLVKSLRGTTLNLKSFLQLAAKYNLSSDFPSYYSHRYFHEKMVGRDDMARLDELNRRNLKLYLENIRVMEQVTRLQTNLALLRKHEAENLAAGRQPIEVEMLALRIGDFVLVTFPGELTVEIGLNIKKSSPHKPTFVAGYTNGYLYYTPTAKQLQNVGGAQEDSDCLLAPAWEQIFYDKVAEMLKQL